MKTFTLGKNKIEFSNDFDTLNEFRKEILMAANEADFSGIVQMFSKKCRPNELPQMLVEKFPIIINQVVCENVVPLAVNFLVENDVYDIDNDTFIEKYYDVFCLENQQGFKEFASEYESVVNEYIEKKAAEEYARANRSQWVGGGFGLSGAIKGAAKAKMLNIGTNALRGIADGVSDSFSEAAFNNRRRGLVTDEVFEDLEQSMYVSFSTIFFASQKEYSRAKGITADWDNNETKKRAYALFNNAAERINNEEKALDIISNAIQMAPYNREYYEYLYENFSSLREQVEELADYLGYSLNALKVELAIDEVNSISDCVSEKFSDLDQEETSAHYSNFYKAAKEVLAIGTTYGLWSGKKKIELTTEPEDECDETDMLLCALSFDAKGLECEINNSINKGKYDEAVNEKFLKACNALKEKYNYAQYKDYYRNILSTVEQLVGGKALSEIEKRNSTEAYQNALLEIDAIFDGSDTTPEKNKQLCALATKYGRSVMGNACSVKGDKFDGLSYAITIAIAGLELEKYAKDIEKQIKEPTLDIVELHEKVINVLLEHNVIEDRDAISVKDDFLPRGYDKEEPHYTSAYKLCQESLVNTAGIINYALDRKHGLDAKRKEKIGRAVLNVCNDVDLSKFKTIHINTALNEGFLKEERGGGGYRKILGIKASIPADETIYICHLKQGFLSEFTAFAYRGIYALDGENTQFYPWRSIQSIIEGSGIAVYLTSGKRISLNFGGIFGGNGGKLGKDIWYAIEGIVHDDRTETPYVQNAGSFICKRLNNSLKGKAKTTSFNSEDRRSSYIEDGVREWASVAEYEPYLHINYYLPGYSYDEHGESDQQNVTGCLLVTNKYMYIVDRNIKRIALANIEDIICEDRCITVKDHWRSCKLPDFGDDIDACKLAGYLRQALIFDIDFDNAVLSPSIETAPQEISAITKSENGRIPAEHTKTIEVPKEEESGADISACKDSQNQIQPHSDSVTVDLSKIEALIVDLCQSNCFENIFGKIGTPIEPSYKMYSKACERFRIPSEDRVYIIHDASLLTGCKKGFALTSSGLYFYKNSAGYYDFVSLANVDIQFDEKFKAIKINTDDWFFDKNSGTVCSILVAIQNAVKRGKIEEVETKRNIDKDISTKSKQSEIQLDKPIESKKSNTVATISEEAISEICEAYRLMITQGPYLILGNPFIDRTARVYTKAVQNFGIPQDDKVFMIYNGTLFGSLKRGFALTTTGYYYSFDKKGSSDLAGFANIEIELVGNDVNTHKTIIGGDCISGLGNHPEFVSVLTEIQSIIKKDLEEKKAKL